MADVTGPVSTLPGSSSRLNPGSTCNDCGAPATRRLQGETDSFGAEFSHLCETCYQKERERLRQKRQELAPCEWCKSITHLSPTRDYDEGLRGPVYYVCSSCRAKQQTALEAEERYWSIR